MCLIALDFKGLIQYLDSKIKVHVMLTSIQNTYCDKTELRELLITG